MSLESHKLYAYTLCMCCTYCSVCTVSCMCCTYCSLCTVWCMWCMQSSTSSSPSLCASTFHLLHWRMIFTVHSSHVQTTWCGCVIDAVCHGVTTASSSLQTALKLGLGYLPLARASLDALETWGSELPSSLLEKHYGKLLPVLDDYLNSPNDSESECVWWCMWW